MFDILLPELGEGISDVEIRDVLIEKGDSLKKDQVILILETDKASMEIPSEHEGLISELYVKTGDKISPNDKILGLKLKDSNSEIETPIIKDSPQNETVDEVIIEKEIENIIETETPSQLPITSSITNSQSHILASPSTRKLARELGCDISLVKGSGEKGRVSREDVLSYVNRFLSSNPSGIGAEELRNILKNEISGIKDNILTELKNQENKPKNDIDFSKWGSIETSPLNKVKQISGNNMINAWTTIPQVTQFDSANISSLYKSYKNLKAKNSNPEIKISLIPFYIKILTKVIQDFPNFNSSLNSKADAVIIKKYITDILSEALISHLNIIIPFMVRLLGVEPRTSWSVAKRSIQLSYRRIFNFI